MRTIAQETAFHIALRNCSKEVGVEGGQYTCDFDEGRRHEIKNILVADVCCQLPEANIIIKDFLFSSS